jgi:hypothetical protein
MGMMDMGADGQDLGNGFKVEKISVPHGAILTLAKKMNGHDWGITLTPEEKDGQIGHACESKKGSERGTNLDTVSILATAALAMGSNFLEREHKAGPKLMAAGMILLSVWEDASKEEAAKYN